MKKNEPTGYYKTEEQLKQEAKQRAAEQARIQAMKPPPSTPKKKADNFWYHYKWHTIAGAFVLVLAAFFLRDVLFRTQPDATVILVTARPVPQETVDELQRALGEAAWDFNGDGKVSFAVDAIFMPGEETTAEDADAAPEINIAAQADYASVMKLTTVIAAGLDPIFLLDDAMYDHLLQMAAGSTEDEQGNVIPNPPTDSDAYTVFERLEIAGGATRIPLAATVLADDPALAPLADTALSLRMTASERNAEYRDYCRAVLESLVIAQAG